MNREDDAALAAYRIIHPDGPAFSTLPDGERARWRDACGVARIVTPVIIKPTCAIALCEAAFNYARMLTGGTPSDKCTIFASSYYGQMLIELRDKYGCKVFELPVDCFVRPGAWVIASGDGIVWSDPVD